MKGMGPPLSPPNLKGGGLVIKLICLKSKRTFYNILGHLPIDFIYVPIVPLKMKAAGC